MSELVELGMAGAVSLCLFGLCLERGHHVAAVLWGFCAFLWLGLALVTAVLP